MSRRAKIRGLPQLGTLGAGNHYAEIQVVEEVFNQQAAKRMGIDRIGQVQTLCHRCALETMTLGVCWSFIHGTLSCALWVTSAIHS